MIDEGKRHSKISKGVIIKSINIADDKTFVDFLPIIKIVNEKLVQEHPESAAIDKKISEKESH